MPPTPTGPRADSVSFEDDLLILVDGNDNEVGHLDKAACHDGDGVRHRAFSIFIVNHRGELLLQQRAAGKRLWPLYWSNSCCSHPRAGEAMADAVTRRLQEELGLSVALEPVYRFEYHARFGQAGSEHELCYVYVGFCDQAPVEHPEEIAAWRWISPEDLDREMCQSPHTFTPWFVLEWRRLRADYPARLQPS
ncbi:MAG: isopentenyl-diphosphate Delta-isomerase [Pseudomonadales bacterium]